MNMLRYFLCALCVLLIIAVPTRADTYIVDTTVDDSDITPDSTCLSGSGCTLRAAIMEIHASGGTGTHTIYIPSNISPYLVDINGAGENFANTGDLDVWGGSSFHLIIQGQGASASNVVIQASSLNDRLFHLQGTNTQLTLRNLTIRNASVGLNGAGIFVGIPASGTLTLNLENVIVDNNATTGGNLGAGLYASTNTTVSLTDSVFTNNNSAGEGGAIYNAGTITISSSTIGNSGNGNSATTGAGIYNTNTGSLTVTTSDIQYNSATGEKGGGIFNNSANCSVSTTTLRNNSSNFPGGGFSNSIGSSNCTISNSLIYNNTSTYTTNLGGGGIYNLGTLTIINSTISTNKAYLAGGGIYNDNAATLNLSNVTIASNLADSDRNGSGTGGGIFEDTSTVNMANSLIADNFDDDATTPVADECKGFIEANDYNLVETDTGCTLNTGTNNITGTDPLLVAIADNGGSTNTHALGSGSAAVDTGNPNPSDGAGINCKATDQRGTARPLDGDGDSTALCDIGAYEKPAPGGGGDGGGGGCYIATAAYGTAMEKDVVTLRRFRDRYLLTNKPGELFTGLYYKLSPPVAAKISTSETLREWARASLIPLVSLGRLLEDADTKDQ